MVNYKIIIRKALETDIDQILLVLRTYNFHVLAPREGHVLDQDFGQEITVYNSVSEIKLDWSWVALIKNQIVGFANYKEENRSIAKTTIMTVLPEFRKLGIGQQLQLARMKEAHQQGYAKMITYCENKEVCAWYTKNFGYITLREEPVCHRLHFIRLKNKIIWGIHYGVKSKYLRVMETKLNNFFKHNETI